MIKKPKTNKSEPLRNIPPGPVPSVTFPVAGTPRTFTTFREERTRVEIPKFKTLLKMLKTSEVNSSKTSRQASSMMSTSRDSFDYVQPPEALSRLKQIQIEPQSNLETTKSQRLTNYRNLLKTTREKFKKNLIEFMNKKREDKIVKNTGYRFPVLKSRSTFRTITTSDDDERLHLNDYNESMAQASKLNSSSLPNLNTYYNFNKNKEKENDFKLPNMRLSKEPIMTEQSLKEDSLFWSKYKRTINRQMKYSNEPHNGASTRMNINRISSINEEESPDFDDRFKSRLTEDQLKKFSHEHLTVYRTSEVAVKY